MIVGAVGPTLADAIGFPQFVPATLVVKGIEGLLVGIVGGQPGGKMWRRVLAVCLGGTWLVLGYFLFEAYIYPYIGRSVPFFRVTDFGAALVEILPNAVQALVSGSVGLGLWKSVSGFSRHIESSEKVLITQEAGEEGAPPQT